MKNLLQDLRFVLRQMGRSPGFAITAVLILGLGIAANVIVFGVLQAMILEPLDVPHADRVVTFAPRQAGYPAFSWPEVRDVRDGSTVFSGVAAFNIGVFGVETNGVSRPAWGYEVSGQYFEVTGTQPFLGRLLGRADDDHPGAAEVAVLSWPTWNSSFGADRNIVGKTVIINKHRYTIVGVTPEGFYGTEKFLQPEIFVPIVNQASLDGVNWLDSRREKNVFPIARMKEGVNLRQAQAEMNTLAARIAKENPGEEAGLAFWLARPGFVGDFLGGAVRRFLSGVMVLAGIVLLAACANLGGLFAARTADRGREIAIRMAIGSSRWRVVRQVMTEALLIALLGGACACGLSWIALTGLARWHPPTDYPMKFLVLPRPSLVVVAFLISLAAAVLFGVIPLRQIFKADPNDAIKSGGNSQPGAGRRWALRDVLLAAQIALCCVTVTAAFVSLRGLGRSLTMNMGFNPRNAALIKFELNEAGYSPDTAESFRRKLLERVLQLPGVEAAGYANGTPLSETNSSPVFDQQANDFRPDKKVFESYDYEVGPGYLAAAETTLLEGRDIRFSDTAEAPRVAVVNQQFARRLYHTEHAVGRYFKDAAGHTVEVVGIVKDGKYFLLAEDAQEAAFFSILQKPSSSTSLVVRGKPDRSGAATAELAAELRKIVHDLDPGVPVRTATPWNNSLGMSFFPAQVATVALGLFGAFGLLLSITGTFGLASYTVSKRLRELSIRVALGAQAKQVLSAALGRMLMLLATGSVAGMLLGVAASRVLASVVFQATAQDPGVMAAVVVTIAVTALLSLAGPVRRALRVDPAYLLREL